MWGSWVLCFVQWLFLQCMWQITGGQRLLFCPCVWEHFYIFACDRRTTRKGACPISRHMNARICSSSPQPSKGWKGMETIMNGHIYINVILLAKHSKGNGGKVRETNRRRGTLLYLSIISCHCSILLRSNKGIKYLQKTIKCPHSYTIDRNFVTLSYSSQNIPDQRKCHKGHLTEI